MSLPAFGYYPDGTAMLRPSAVCEPLHQYAWAAIVAAVLWTGWTVGPVVLMTGAAPARASLLELLCLVAGGSFLWRARANVDVLAPTAPQTRSRYWIWFGWTIPVLSLWFPYLVVRDIVRASTGQPNTGHWVTGQWVTGLLVVWWAAWLTAQGALVVAAQLSRPAHLVAAAALVTACVLWVLVVLVIQRAQHRQL